MNKYTITEIRPKIFFVNFKDSYDMCMTFLRYQEFYESPSPKFRNKIFTIFDYMKWYSKKYGNGAFTYPKDWSGFNIPGKIPNQVFEYITDWNNYDNNMRDVFEFCKSKYPSSTNDFYIIGAVGKNGALTHEISHGFFSSNKNYKKEMLKLVSKLPKEIYKNFCAKLSKMGYTSKVFKDEIQAYLSTGLFDELCFAKPYEEDFIKIFNKYNENKS